MKEFLRHIFVPHTSNNYRARLLHHDMVLGLVGLLLCSTVLFSGIEKYFPSVLGTAIDLSVKDLVALTNQQRSSMGLNTLTYNPVLSEAAAEKAKNMLRENYWAHNAPDGKTPWSFMKQVGYTYLYAGENLARGFTSSNEVMDAWMASPEHKANILSPHYQEIGFAIAKGNLTGENNTTLIVEMFGGQTEGLVESPAKKTQQTTSLPIPDTLQTKEAFSFDRIAQAPLIHLNKMTRNIGVMILGIFIVLLLLDIVIIERKKIVRVIGHNLDHIFFLTMVIMVLFVTHKGVIF